MAEVGQDTGASISITYLLLDFIIYNISTFFYLTITSTFRLYYLHCYTDLISTTT